MLCSSLYPWAHWAREVSMRIRPGMSVEEFLAVKYNKGRSLTTLPDHGSRLAVELKDTINELPIRRVSAEELNRPQRPIIIEYSGQFRRLDDTRELVGDLRKVG